MSLAKVIEVISEGSSVEEAIENAAKEASDTIRNVRHINVDNIQALVDGGSVSKYRVNAKVTFVIEGDTPS